MIGPSCTNKADLYDSVCVCVFLIMMSKLMDMFKNNLIMNIKKLHTFAFIFDAKYNIGKRKINGNLDSFCVVCLCARELYVR